MASARPRWLQEPQRKWQLVVLLAWCLAFESAGCQQSLGECGGHAQVRPDPGGSGQGDRLDRLLSRHWAGSGVLGFDEGHPEGPYRSQKGGPEGSKIDTGQSHQGGSVASVRQGHEGDLRAGAQKVSQRSGAYRRRLRERARPGSRCRRAGQTPCYAGPHGSAEARAHEGRPLDLYVLGGAPFSSSRVPGDGRWLSSRSPSSRISSDCCHGGLAGHWHCQFGVGRFSDFGFWFFGFRSRGGDKGVGSAVLPHPSVSLQPSLPLSQSLRFVHSLPLCCPFRPRQRRQHCRLLLV